MLPPRVSTMNDVPAAESGRWRVPIRSVWAGVILLTCGLFVTGIPVIWPQLRTPCAGSGCARWQLTPDMAGRLPAHHLSIEAFAAYSLTLDAFFVLGFCAIATVIMLRGAGEPMAVLASFMLAAFGPSFSNTIVAASEHSSLAWWPRTVLACAGWAALFTFFYRFPDGAFVPRWTRWLAAAWTAFVILAFFAPGGWVIKQGDDRTRSGPLFGIGVLLFFASVVALQIYRFRCVSTPVQRQQTKWVVYGFFLAFGGLALNILVLGGLVTKDALIADLLLLLWFYAVLLLLPVSIGIAVLRSRLWDIDLIINRTLVYVGLTALVAGLYILIVGYLGTLLRVGRTLPVSLVATGVVAVVFQPLRQWLQHGVNRLLYGERDDPYAVLSRLGAHLEAILAPDAALLAIVETVAQTLKLPYVAIVLAHGNDAGITVSQGTQTTHALTLPLVYGAEPIGQLVAGCRPGEPAFSPADRRLLTDLARQASVAAYTVRLTADLQRARERLVTTREEERRRLRRDLHDGLGPALSALSLRLGAARNLLPNDPARADAMLAELIDEVAAAVGDIRRLVYGLRPPSLDDLGLVGALHAYAAQLNAEGGQVDVRIEVDGPLPALPAAIEVAAYRITQEALTNMTRHAKARTCRVMVQSTAAALRVEIVDDGIGLPPEHRAGVGFVSMRERAEEVGGTCRIESMPKRGTHVVAELPFPAGGAS